MVTDDRIELCVYLRVTNRPDTNPNRWVIRLKHYVNLPTRLRPVNSNRCGTPRVGWGLSEITRPPALRASCLLEVSVTCPSHPPLTREPVASSLDGGRDGVLRPRPGHRPLPTFC